MHKLSTLALAGIAATALAGAAIAADQKMKTMTVPLADGSSVMIEYAGDAAPKVRVRPAPVDRWSVGLPLFADFDRLFADMNRRHAEMMRRVDALASQPLVAGGPAVNLASTGGGPEGSTSVSVVSVTNGGKTCTRTTQVVSQGAGKPPSVKTDVSGDCGPETKSGASSAPLSHT